MPSDATNPRVEQAVTIPPIVTPSVLTLKQKACLMGLMLMPAVIPTLLLIQDAVVGPIRDPLWSVEVVAALGGGVVATVLSVVLGFPKVLALAPSWFKLACVLVFLTSVGIAWDHSEPTGGCNCAGSEEVHGQH